ncbi:MAG: glycosyltransferase [Deltaproteobacteria bacterium]|nr:glycosyltransferase [Deltaproteobacteria bacterium]
MNELYEENPSNVRDAEIVVGIPSYNKPKGITLPTEKADEGLVEFFPNRKSVILNCASHSDDGTKEAFLGVRTEVPKIYLATGEAVTGKGNSLRNLFRKAVELKARAVLVVDADPSSITPRWIKNLGDPLFRNFGFVSPLYLHHRFEETFTNNIAYPLVRTLYGRRVRQPLGGDVGFSGELARLYLENRPWDERISHMGIDIWMITLAITHGVPICQSFMGRPKEQKPKDPAADLGPTFDEVVGTIFTMMGHYEAKWRSIKWSKPTAIFGFGQGQMETIPDVQVDKKSLYTRFTRGAEMMIDRWKTILAPEVFSKLTEVAEIGEERFDFPTELWAKILFDYAVAFRRGGREADSLFDSLLPLYYGRALSDVNKVEVMSTQQAEEYVEDQCLVFEEAKPYLLRRWDER